MLEMNRLACALKGLQRWTGSTSDAISHPPMIDLRQARFTTVQGISLFRLILRGLVTWRFGTV
jgi:hypothetical protein